MTISYNREVATISGFGVFWKLLLRWRGSIYKLIWKEMIIYISIYYVLRSINHILLTSEQQKKFDAVVLYCRSYSTQIPISFVLGFYVNLVMKRWWEQYKALPWPDNLAVYVTNLIHGQDDRGRLMRRTMMRYVNLSFVLTLSMISPRVKKRFPTMDHLVEAGFMNREEKMIYSNFMSNFHNSLYWMPLVWAGTIAMRARKEGRIRDDFACKTILDTINDFRTGLASLLGYDNMSIPLVYTQVVTLAVYSFFAGQLLAVQFIHDSNPSVIDLFVPWFSLLQYLFYVGWLKVAETLINPFGEDDDDFELNRLIDRHFKLSYLIVDEMHNEHPDLVQDKYWDEIMPSDLPYTVATENDRKPPLPSSTDNIELTKLQQLFVKHSGDTSGRSTPSGSRRRRPSLQLSDTTKLERIDENACTINHDLWTSEFLAPNQNKGIFAFFSHLPWAKSSSLKSEDGSVSFPCKCCNRADQLCSTANSKFFIGIEDTKV